MTPHALRWLLLATSLVAACATPPPRYGTGPQAQTLEDAVDLRIRIDPNGQVRTWQVLGKPPEALVQATTLYVQHWRFKPPTRGGQPVTLWLGFSRVYRLE